MPVFKQYGPGKYTGFALLTCFVFLLPACSDKPREGLSFGLASAPVTLDPRLATDATSSRINRLLYDRLVDFNDATQAAPSLADWTMLSSTHYRFVLRQDKTFHHGRPLSSMDVKATYDFILNPANASAHRASLTLVERIEIPDARTIDFFLSKPDPLFPGYLVVGIVPADLSAQGHGFNREPVGSGDFKFSDWPEEGRLVIERLRDGLKIELLRVPNPTVRVLKLLRGEIDMMQNDLLPELVTYLAAQPGISVKKARGTNYAYLGFNMQDPVVGNVLVRRAVAHALDRHTIIKYVMGNAARPASAILPPDHWAGHDHLEPIPYDPDLARQLLQQAGYSESNPATITYKTTNDPFRVRLATIIQNQLDQVGIKVEIRSYDWGTFYGDIKRGIFQMYSLAWVGINSPDIFYYVFHSEAVPPNGANRGRFVDKETDRLIDEARNEQDREHMAQKYKKLQQSLLRTLPYVPLWYEDHIYVAREGIEGYELAANGKYDGLRHVRVQKKKQGAQAPMVMK